LTKQPIYSARLALMFSTYIDNILK